MLVAAPAANETSAARRRQRRLRQFLRLERLTVAMLLAEREGYEVKRTAKFRKNLLPPPPLFLSHEPGTQHFFLDNDSVPKLGGTRPDRLASGRRSRYSGLAEPRGDVERVQRHAVDQMVDAPLLPTFDVPVPLMVE